MSENVHSLFEEAGKDAANGSVRSLAGTAQLTTLAAGIAKDVLNTVEVNFDQYQELLSKSKGDSNALDKLITSAYDMTAVDVQFLTELEEAVLNSMLKSQQSKRSRSKSSVMTMDNYRNMMNAAICEILLRKALDKPKTHAGPRRSAGTIEYTVEELEAMKEDQEKLRKELRNVQSKKSICKSKADFSEESPLYQGLLVAEAQLKSIRITTRGTDATKGKLAALLQGTDLSTLKGSDAKKLLEEIATLAGEIPDA